MWTGRVAFLSLVTAVGATETTWVRPPEGGRTHVRLELREVVRPREKSLFATLTVLGVMSCPMVEAVRMPHRAASHSSVPCSSSR